MKQFLFLIYFILFIKPTFEACLAKETLVSIFGDAKDFPSTSNDYCTGLFDVDKGSCVESRDVKIKIEEANAAISRAFAPFEDFVNAFDAYYDFNYALVGGEDQLTAEQRVLLDKQRRFYTDQFENNTKPCLEAYANLQQGFLCYTASEKAGENAIGSYKQMIVKTLGSSLASLNSCFYIITALCVTSTPMSLGYYDPSLKPLNKEFDDRCLGFAFDTECSISYIDKCEHIGYAVGKHFFEIDNLNIFPDRDYIMETKRRFEELTKIVNKNNRKGMGQVSGLLNRMSGLEMPTEPWPMSLIADMNGADLKTYGEMSGIVFSYALLIKTVITTVFIFMLS